MNLVLDHLIIAVNDLDEAITTYREAGFRVHYGGQHVGGGTHNALVVFADGTYLELLAKTRPDAPTPYESYFANGEGCAGFALAVGNIDACRNFLLEQSYPAQSIKDGGRTRADGIPLQWRVMPVGEAPFPFLIEDVTPRNLRVPYDPDWINHPNKSTGIASIAAGIAPAQLSALQALVEWSGHEILTRNGRVAFQLGQTRFLLDDSPDAEVGSSKVEFTIVYEEVGL